MFFEKVKKYFKIFNNKKILMFFCLAALLALFYLSFLPVISPDSTWYYNLSNIIKGNGPFDQWWQVRGPVLPFIISLITYIFGDNPRGFLVGTFIFYLIMVFSILFITKKITASLNNAAKIFIYILIVFMIFLNPVIIGYYHAMLTEFVATTAAVICCWISYKWVDFSLEKNTKFKYALYIFVFGTLIGLMWLLKQPYITVAALPFLIASFMSMIKNDNIKNIMSKTIAVIASFLLAIFISISWNSFLCREIACKTNATGGYFSDGLINGVSSIRRIRSIDEINDILNNNSSKSTYLNAEEKDLISNASKDENNFKSYAIFDIRGSGGKTIDLMVAKSSSENGILSTNESASFLTSVFIEHPYIVLKSYTKNYLAAINIISFTIENKVYYPISKNYFQNGGENVSLSYASFIERPIYWWPVGMRPQAADPLIKYEVNNKPNNIAHSMFQFIKTPSLYLFSITFIIIPVTFLYCLVKFLKNKLSKSSQKVDKINELLLILFGFSFINAIAHILTGAIIDRYLSVGYPVALLGIILLIGSNIKMKKAEDSFEMKKSNKLLFVIPAYNEALNIGPVIKDIKNNIPEADVLVINDCSKDNTREVVEGAGVKCITMPFNVRYAMAVQTGIKYAKDNNYGYVIQFDADGQHLASEAKLLYVEMKKTNSDIVIGSRFIKRTDYKHSLPRMLGTKMFSGIIFLFSGQKITDPTSGLQCLNGRVIEKYSKMGEYPEYPDANLIIDMLFKGYKISEVGVKMKQRENGVSMHSGILKPIKYMIKITYAIFAIIINSFEFRKGDK